MSSTFLLNCSGVIPIEIRLSCGILQGCSSHIITMSNPDIKSLLEKLHVDVASELLDRIASGEATSAEISVAVKFLKDNDVTVVVEESKPMLNLVKALPFTEAKEA
jgi:hypothetical protein